MQLRYWTVLLFALLASTGCQFVTVDGEPYRNDQGVGVPAPQTLAILPTTAPKKYEAYATPMRNALMSALAPQAYDDKEFRQVDANLAKLASCQGCLPEQLPREAKADPSLADLVIFSDLTNVNRLWIPFYSHVRVDMDLAMVDTRTRAILYQGSFTIRNRIGTSPYSIFGLIESGLVSLWHLRSSQIEEAFEEGAQEIAENIPLFYQKTVSGNGLQLRSIEVITASETLGPGQEIRVQAHATTGCQVNFNIGRNITAIPMPERSPGFYEGTYTVKQNDHLPYGVVEVNVCHPQTGQTLQSVANDQPLVIDTQAPKAGYVSRWWQVRGEPGLFVLIEQDTPTQEIPDTDLPLEYYIYRCPSGQKSFVRVAVSDQSTVHDILAKSDTSYDYYVQVRDAAGNLSSPGPITRLTPR